MARQADIQRKTRETEIHLQLDLDGKGKYDINTGIPFYSINVKFLTLPYKGRFGSINYNESDFHHLQLIILNSLCEGLNCKCNLRLSEPVMVGGFSIGINYVIC